MATKFETKLTITELVIASTGVVKVIKTATANAVFWQNQMQLKPWLYARPWM